MIKYITLAFAILLHLMGSAQHTSIHAEQSAYYTALGQKADVQYDSINGFEGRLPRERSLSQLQKRVFGYHPYWMGNAWQNYRWDLLSDLCYFSYDTDPATGNPITTNGFETAAVIDTALVHGVRVHLCVTLFSGHKAFFANQQAQQTLIANIITLMAQRGAMGVNIDFEAVPSSQQQGLTNFLVQLSGALHPAIPGAELSIAAPAVNWNNTFDLQAIAPVVDLVMVMAYDYYWNGSSLAGPVSGYWPLTSSFDYSVSRSLSYYQSQGVPNEKLLLGLPYYGREWPVNSNTFPAATTGIGTAVTYRNVRGNSSGFYTPSNYYWDYLSYNPYYSYFNNNWRQCFYDGTRSLGAKYNMVNRRNIAGIGIWALGYDNGYPELWDLIDEKFAHNPVQLCRDTIYDNGGPWWNYGDNDEYTETVVIDSPGTLSLQFEQLSLESGFDSLWIYDGPDVASPLLASLSGDQIPTGIITAGNVFTIRLHSDGASTRAGYSLVWSCPTAAVDELPVPGLETFPNPAKDQLNIHFTGGLRNSWTTSLFDITGKLVRSKKINGSDEFIMNVAGLNPGLYLLLVVSGDQLVTQKILLE